MAARLLSRVAFHLPLFFSARTSVNQKPPRNVFKNTLLPSSPDVVKLRSQLAVFIVPTSERRRSWSYAKEVAECTRCTSLCSDASLWLPCAMKHRKQLECLQSCNWHGKNNHHCVTKRVGSHKKKPTRSENPLEVETHSKWKPTRGGNTDDRTRGTKEWRAKRKLEFQGMVEDWSTPMKRETRLSKVWFKSCFRYTWY